MGMRQKRFGFSLMELLATLIILSIMATITMGILRNRRREGELRGAAAQIMAIVSAEKNYFYTFRVYTPTTSTANTNSVLGIRIVDGFFHNYRVGTAAGSFSVNVTAGNGEYRFNAAGNQVSCAGSDCVS